MSSLALADALLAAPNPLTIFVRSAFAFAALVTPSLTTPCTTSRTLVALVCQPSSALQNPTVHVSTSVVLAPAGAATTTLVPATAAAVAIATVTEIRNRRTQPSNAVRPSSRSVTPPARTIGACPRDGSRR